MGSLRDQLLKAKLIEEKDARKARHQERIRRKEKGREGARREQEERRRQAEERRAEQRERDRRAAPARREAKPAPAGDRSTALQLALTDERVVRDVGGTRRFHFVDRQGRIPFLEVSDRASRRLMAGELVIVERPTDRPRPEHVLVEASALRLIRGIDPQAVRFHATSTGASR